MRLFKNEELVERLSALAVIILSSACPVARIPGTRRTEGLSEA